MDFQEAAKLALDKNLPWLKDNLSNWPKDCCEDTCWQIYSDLKGLLRGHYDCRSLQVRSGYFCTLEASGNDPSSIYGNHWEVAHAWIAWKDVIIDPTASQFLPYLPNTVLIATPEMIEHSFYLLKTR